MGRLQTWIDRLGRSRSSSARARLARQRPLGFELCESRLALSAASPAGDMIDNSVDFSLFLSNLWEQTPGTAAWTRVTFSVVHDPVTTQESLQTDFAVNPIALPPLRANRMEGGVIAFDAFAADRLQSWIASRQSYAIVDAAFGGFDAGLRIESTAASLLGSDLGPATQGVAILPDNVESAPTWNFQPTDVPDLLGGAESPSPMVEGSALTTTPPILRITAPLDPARTEGGRIDLTAMAGPTSLDRPSSLGSLATQRVAARTTDDLPAAANSQNLRARAVVYEVAYELDAERDPAPEEIGAALDGEAERDGASDDAAPIRDAMPLARREGDAPVAEPTAASVLEAAKGSGEAATQATPDASDSARGDAAKEYDAALALWGDDHDAAESLEGDADGGLALADARQRDVGLAIALAATAAPLARRYRRSRQVHAAERNAGLL